MAGARRILGLAPDVGAGKAHRAVAEADDLEIAEADGGGGVGEDGGLRGCHGHPGRLGVGLALAVPHAPARREGDAFRARRGACFGHHAMNRAFFGCTAPDSVMGSDLRGIGALAAALLASGLLACGSSSGGTSPRTTGIDGGDTGSAASGDSGSASAMDATTDSPDGASTDAKPTDATVDATLPDATLPPPGDVGPAGFDASALQSAASALGPGQWFELPATNKLSDVFPTGMTGNWGSASGAANVVNAWGGGAVAEGALFVWGGGHNDYGGNEVYSFDLGSFTWSRVTNPSDYVTYPCGYSSPGGPCVTVDGTPVSAHSYEGINFIPTLGKVWVGGGAPYST